MNAAAADSILICYRISIWIIDWIAYSTYIFMDISFTDQISSSTFFTSFLIKIVLWRYFWLFALMDRMIDIWLCKCKVSLTVENHLNFEKFKYFSICYLNSIVLVIKDTMLETTQKLIYVYTNYHHRTGAEPRGGGIGGQSIIFHRKHFLSPPLQILLKNVLSKNYKTI